MTNPRNFKEYLNTISEWEALLIQSYKQVVTPAEIKEILRGTNKYTYCLMEERKWLKILQMGCGDRGKILAQHSGHAEGQP